MAWTNMSTKANGVVIDQGDWNQMVANFAALGGADGNTKASGYVIGGAVTINAGGLTINGSGVNIVTGTFWMGATPAGSGAVRLTNGNAVAWRNNANNSDLLLYSDTADRLTLGSVGASGWSTAGTAGSVQQYLSIMVNGVAFKIALLAV